NLGLNHVESVIYGRFTRTEQSISQGQCTSDLFYVDQLFQFLLKLFLLTINQTGLTQLLHLEIPVIAVRTLFLVKFYQLVPLLLKVSVVVILLTICSSFGFICRNIVNNCKLELKVPKQ